MVRLRDTSSIFGDFVRVAIPLSSSIVRYAVCNSGVGSEHRIVSNGIIWIDPSRTFVTQEFL